MSSDIQQTSKNKIVKNLLKFIVELIFWPISIPLRVWPKVKLNPAIKIAVLIPWVIISLFVSLLFLGLIVGLAAPKPTEITIKIQGITENQIIKDSRISLEIKTNPISVDDLEVNGAKIKKRWNSTMYKYEADFEEGNNVIKVNATSGNLKAEKIINFKVDLTEHKAKELENKIAQEKKIQEENENKRLDDLKKEAEKSDETQIQLQKDEEQKLLNEIGKLEKEKNEQARILEESKSKQAEADKELKRLEEENQLKAQELKRIEIESSQSAQVNSNKLFARKNGNKLLITSTFAEEIRIRNLFLKNTTTWIEEEGRSFSNQLGAEYNFPYDDQIRTEGGSIIINPNSTFEINFSGFQINPSATNSETASILPAIDIAYYHITFYRISNPLEIESVTSKFD